MLEQLELYINAQKTIANFIMGLGVIMILLAILFDFAENSLFNGLKAGLFVVGFISLDSGYGYRLTETKLLEKQKTLYKESPARFHQLEKERMVKVVKSFPFYQIAFIIAIFICLLVIFFTKNNFVNGILFAVIIFLLGNTVIEKVSETSIDSYYKKLSNID